MILPDPSTVIAPTLLLPHAPPDGVPVKPAVPPTQIDAVPLITGSALTVTSTLLVQPPPVVYTIVPVAVTVLVPVTRPEDEPTDTIEDEVLHTPPLTVL